MMDRAPFTLAPAGNPPALGPAWLGGGVFLARVIDLADPDGRGRIRIRLQGSDGIDGQDVPLWALLVTPHAGDERGMWWLPEIDDLVAVTFVQGDARLPVVLGALWHGAAKPPVAMDGASRNDKKLLRTRSGLTITLDDASGQETLKLETPGGQVLELKDGPGQCTLSDANGNSIKLESSGITITAAAKVTVNAANVKVSAGMVQVDAGLSKFSGVVQCDTLITNAVVSSSYTPGAGNVW
jgi:uncharacterized protein involved in type VI secretion and phage assembly